MNPFDFMQEKPTLLYVIDSLAIGGAETLLIDILHDLSADYEVVIATLYDGCEYDESRLANAKRYCLFYNGFKSIPACAVKLRRIIKKHQPVLVHAHLYTSSLITRIATPKKIPLVFSIHTMLSIENYNKKRFSLLAERMTYHKHHRVIGVSKQTIADFDKYVGLKGPSHTLYNFINPVYFQKSRVAAPINGRQLKLVAVGNLKEVKNYGFLIQAFKDLKDLPVALDIFGDGPLRQELQKAIDESGVNITLKGSSKEIYQVLPAYDMYVMCSLYEGFPVAPLEAMAVGLPLLLSELPVLRESVGTNGLFFDQKDPQSFVRVIRNVLAGKIDLPSFSEKGMALARNEYQQKDYLHRLQNIYQEMVAG
jgi:glycosyltransferase involved in cell wall biosynthesis